MLPQENLDARRPLSKPGHSYVQNLICSAIHSEKSFNSCYTHSNVKALIIRHH